MDDARARELIARERARIESELAKLGGEIRDEGRVERQQSGEYGDAGSGLATEAVAAALVADLRDQLDAVVRAEERLVEGVYGMSVDSGLPIPDARLEVEPLAERTVEEQRLFEKGGPRPSPA